MISKDSLDLPQPAGPTLSAVHPARRADHVPDRAARAGGWQRLPTTPRSKSSCSSGARSTICWPAASHAARRNGPSAAANAGPGRGLQKLQDTRSPGPPEEARQDPRSDRPAQGPLSQGPLPSSTSRWPGPSRRQLSWTLAIGQVPDGPGPRRRLSAAQQPGRLVGPGVLGDLHPVDRGGTSLPRPQERTAAAARSGTTTAAGPRPTCSSASWPTPCGRPWIIWPSKPAC